MSRTSPAFVVILPVVPDPEREMSQTTFNECLERLAANAPASSPVSEPIEPRPARARPTFLVSSGLFVMVALA